MRQRISVLFSLRFGITAWYAGVLIVTIALLGIGLRAFLIRSLDERAEDRLVNAAYDIDGQIDEETYTDPGSDGSRSFQIINPRDLDIRSILLSGVSVTIVDASFPQPLHQSGALANLWPNEIDIQRALRSSEPRYSTFRASGYMIRGFTYPILSEEVTDPRTGQPQIIGVIFTSESLLGTTQMLGQFNKILLAFGAVGAATASIGGWILAGRALMPVNRFMTAADDIANDRSAASLSRRLDIPPTGDEFAQLGVTFNEMLDRIEQSFQAQQRFVADASHELRTPLTSIKGNVDVLRRQLASGRKTDPADIDEALADVSRESARMGRLVSDLLSLTRTEGDPTSRQSTDDAIDLVLLAREAYRTAEVLVDEQQMTLDVPAEVLIHGDGDRLVQVMLILLDNALRHSGAGDCVTLRISEASDPQDKVLCARIEVDDTGSGIEPEHLPHLFERFYRAEGSRARTLGGTGLGLAIALSIVRAHHGWIDVQSTPGEGSRFCVWLPKRSTEKAAPAPRRRVGRRNPSV